MDRGDRAPAARDGHPPGGVLHPEHWEEAGHPPALLHHGSACPENLPPCVVLGDLTADEARDARARYGIPEGAVTDADAAHPLTLRLLADVRSDVAATAPDGPVDRDDVLAAHLDLTCLRIAQRLAGGLGARGTAVRRLAVRAAGKAHEAARRCLGTEDGALDRASFEELFPVSGPGSAVDSTDATGPGWADAVLAEGLLVPAGDGYRFGHEELADWLQGAHLDLDGALHTLVHTPAADTAPVPRHRIGPVAEALLCLARRHGPARLASRLADLTHALDADPGSWWASRLLTGVLIRVPDAGPYTDVLRLLADRVVAWREQRRTVPPELGPAFWTRLRLPVEARCALLRRLVLADGPPCESGPRFLDAAAGLLTADPATVLPYLVRWFDDERPLPATPHATVATAAQALLHTHRRAAPDALTEALVDSPHRRADELLAVLAEEEPGVLCRAVDRWAEDPAQPAVPQPSPMACGSRRTPATSTTAPCCGTPPSPSWCAPPTAPCTAAPSPSSSVTRTAGDATSPAPSNGSRPATRTSRRARSPTPSPPTPNPSSKRSVPGSPRARTRRTPSAPSPTPPRPPWPARSPPSSGRRPPGGPS